MGDPKGDMLYVDLPASEVRRRLKGFGHGVRKIQSAESKAGLTDCPPALPTFHSCGWQVAYLSAS